MTGKYVKSARRPGRPRVRWGKLKRWAMLGVCLSCARNRGRDPEEFLVHAREWATVLARHHEGAVWAWGYNAFSQLAGGATPRPATAVQGPEQRGGTALAAAIPLADLHRGGTARVWGRGPLGLGGEPVTRYLVTPQAAEPPRTFSSDTSVSQGTAWAWKKGSTHQDGLAI